MSSAPDSGPSWRSIVLLILVLLAATGMTLWITYGAMQTTPDRSIKTSPWDSIPPTVAGTQFPEDEASAFPLLFGVQPGDPNALPPSPSDVPSSDDPNSAYSVGGSNARNIPLGGSGQLGPSDGALGPVHLNHERLAQLPASNHPYQVTDSPEQRKIPVSSEPDPLSVESPTTLPAATSEPDSTYPTTAPVSFRGHIETPNLRARNDRQRSILH